MPICNPLPFTECSGENGSIQECAAQGAADAIRESLDDEDCRKIAMQWKELPVPLKAAIIGIAQSCDVESRTK